MSTSGELQIRDLLLRFPGQEQALFNIPSLDVPPGSSLGIRGPSGAGKTTLFHCLAGIATPTSGQICWDAIDICSMRADVLDRWRHRSLGLIFQDFHLIDGLSALDNVLLPAHFDGWRPAAVLRHRALELLAEVGISTFDRMAALLSRGERQRVAFARALLFRPAIVMADEPTASLDPDHRTQIGDLLVSLVRSQGATLIVISHEHELLSRMDRCVTLQDGCLHSTPIPEFLTRQRGHPEMA
ncbi:MAG: ABC transporter ATP-binding protein [Formivibrio sp.]|nr:ABC transporter ATP-binding protein [Formivibrio sp.]